ncbi:MAG: AAA family ATPase [Clostridia bacterium]|nr:AAA family ATPase [Clostridia bacterium]
MEYGCIGEHLTHSFSKEIHNALADYQYVLKELSPDKLEGFIKERDFKAINVTIPYKKDVIPYLDWISPEAESINAVNTIVNKDGKLYGYNTDFYGLKSLVEKHNISLKGKRVAVLGSGGTSNTACAVSENMGAASIIKVSRSERKGYITYEELYKDYSDVQIIINTTPCGMFPNTGESPVDLSGFTELEAVFDAVYNPLSSKLVLDARKTGVTAVGGLYMLVSQAAYAVEKFIDTPVNSNKIEKIYRSLFKDKMNIVLIGMPGCGKSTIGKALAQRLSKKLVDTDSLIVERCGKSISDIFADEGETSFRQIEAEVIEDVSKLNGQIICTGGGAVLNEKNMELLKSNGRLFFIDRPLDLLIATADRPLSSNRADLERLYNQRLSLYKKYAHVIVDGSAAVKNVAEEIEVDYNGYSCD